MRFTIFSALLLVALTLSVIPLTDWLVDRQFEQAAMTRSQVEALDDLVGRELVRIPSKAELRGMYNTKAKVDAGIKSLFAGR